MAEVIGVIAAVGAVAEYGFKLSVKLFAFGQAVASADESVREISTEVSLTSTVLQELCPLLKGDDSIAVSTAALEATHATVKECLRVFEQIGEAVDKSLARLGELDVPLFAASGRKQKRGGVAVLEKLKWPFRQTKLDLLRTNLDRLKSSLALMLQVLSYARDVSNQNIARSTLVYQQHIIGNLANMERKMTKKLHSLQDSVEGQGSPSITVLAASTSNISFQTLDRSIGNDGSHFQPTAPLAASRALERTIIRTSETETLRSARYPSGSIRLGELLLCFRLLSDLLDHLNRDRRSDQDSSFEELRSIFKIAQERITKLRDDDGDVSSGTLSISSQTLRRRLDQVVEAALKSRTTEEAINTQINYELPYDPYIPVISGAPNSGAKTNSRTAELQRQIDETVGVMRDSIGHVTQRGERLDALVDSSDNLSVSTQAFRRGANRARKSWPSLRSLGSWASQTVTEASTAGYMATQGLSEWVYDMGASFMFVRDTTREYDESGNEDDSDLDDEEVAEGLLAKWTLTRQTPATDKREELAVSSEGTKSAVEQK